MNGAAMPIDAPLRSHARRQPGVTFGIPVASDAAPEARERRMDLLGATLRSLIAQSDPNWRALVAAGPEAEKPPEAADERIRWTEVPSSPDNDYPNALREITRKRARMFDLAAVNGVSHLMWLDADDLLHPGLVGHVRAHAGAPGFAVETGLLLDHSTGRVASVPTPEVYPGPFYRLCGSGLINGLDFLNPGAPDRVHAVMLSDMIVRFEHPQVPTMMLAMDRPYRAVSFPAVAYRVRTGFNLSLHPTTKHRSGNQSIHERLARHSRPPTAAECAAFDLPAVRVDLPA